MNNIVYLVVTNFIPKTDLPLTSVSNILKNEEDAWFYVGQMVDEVSKKDKNPTIVIKQFKKEVIVLETLYNYPDPTPSAFIFSIHKTHFSKLTSDKKC